MKIIPNTKVDFAKLKLLSSSTTPRQFYQINTDQFLIVCHEPKMMLAVESDSLTELIDGLRSDILDLEFFAIQPLICRQNERLEQSEFELRLYLRTGDTYVINSQDDVLIL